MTYENDYITNLMLDAGLAITSNDPRKAKNLLEEVLIAEPAYSIAHNHLGWLYMYFLNNFQLAECHLRLAIKFSPPYPEAFQHLGTLMLWEHKYKDAEAILRKALEYEEVNKPMVYEELGRIYELKGKLFQARRHYRTAVKSSLDDTHISHLRSNLKRLRVKMFLL